MRDTAALLDCLAVPQPGDPFVPAKPPGPYRQWLERSLEPLRIAYSVKPFFDAPLDPEIAAAVRRTAKVLEDMGHHVEQADIPFDQEQASKEMVWIWFFGFDRWLDQLGSKTGRTPGPDTLEPVTWETYKLAKSMDPHRFLDGLDWLNASRRELGAFFTRHDVLLTPTCTETAPPLGPYGMNIKDMSLMEWMVHSEKPVQYCFMYNVAGARCRTLAQRSNGTRSASSSARPSEDHLCRAPPFSSRPYLARPPAAGPCQPGEGLNAKFSGLCAVRHNGPAASLAKPHLGNCALTGGAFHGT